MGNYFSIKNRIFYNFLVLIILIVFITYLSYATQQNNYNELIDYTVESKLNEIRENIIKSDNATQNLAQAREKVFKKIHLKARERLLSQPTLNLNDLREELKKNLPPDLIDLHLYLIENTIVYNTTYIQDLHLDMSHFPGAMLDIKEAYKYPNEIIIAPPSIDILKKDYRIYSYSVLDIEAEKVLEVGFFDSDITRLKKDLLSYNVKNSLIDEIALYTKYADSIYNLLNLKPLGETSKENYLSHRDETIISHESNIVREILSLKKPKTYEFEENFKKFKVFYLLIDNVYNERVGYYVLKVKLDISSFENNLNQLRLTFYISLGISLLFVIMFYTFLRNAYVRPLDEILTHMISWKKVTNNKLLRNNDEFSKLANSFNEAYERQENMNKTLEERVASEVQKNKEKEKHLIEQSKLAQMGQLLSMIAHQWRQPLGAIQSGLINLELILWEDKSSVEKTPLFEKIKTLGQYVQLLSHTIDDFRNFHKAEKKKELISGVVPVEKALQISLTSMEAKNILIETHFNANNEIWIHLNEILQVILNIIKNSEDNFLEKNTTNPTISISTFLDNHTFIINICDNGGGIKSEILTDIFEPYFSTKDEKNGTGLGLYISKIIIEEHHGGTLSVKNIPNGVCFQIGLAITTE